MSLLCISQLRTFAEHLVIPQDQSVNQSVKSGSPGGQGQGKISVEAFGVIGKARVHTAIAKH